LLQRLVRIDVWLAHIGRKLQVRTDRSRVWDVSA